jgi:hypothetical protein
MRSSRGVATLMCWRKGGGVRSACDGELKYSSNILLAPTLSFSLILGCKRIAALTVDASTFS